MRLKNQHISNIPRIILFIFVFWNVSSSAQSQKIKFTGKVHFVSDAPLEWIEAESRQLQGIIDINSQTFAFSVEVASFDGFNSALQKEHFHENYMESKKYPRLTYTGTLLDKPDFSKDGVYECRTKGKFTIHGVEKERILKHSITVKKGKIDIKSEFTIALADYRISIPKIVYKKIAEEIDITVQSSATLP